MREIWLLIFPNSKSNWGNSVVKTVSYSIYPSVGMKLHGKTKKKIWTIRTKVKEQYGFIFQAYVFFSKVSSMAMLSGVLIYILSVLEITGVVLWLAGVPFSLIAPMYWISPSPAQGYNGNVLPNAVHPHLCPNSSRVGYLQRPPSSRVAASVGGLCLLCPGLLPQQGHRSSVHGLLQHLAALSLPCAAASPLL